MTKAARNDLDAPIWARKDAFPKCPPGWGWLDTKGRPHPSDSNDSLIAAIRDDRNADITLVWTPGHAHMILPEEVEGSAAAVLAARKRRAADDLVDSHDKLRWFGLLLGGLAVYMLYKGWILAPGSAAPVQRLGFGLRALFSSMSLGITLLMFLIFAFIPWYQAKKQLKELSRWTDGDTAAIIPLLRFETWLDSQKAPVTRTLLGLITLVAMAQIFCEWKTAGFGSLLAVFNNWGGIPFAGLVKGPTLHAEWWRFLTSPLLHGNLIHFLMNAAALIYLGKRIEVFARWPHVPLVFLFSAFVGGEVSARLVATTSVGASGGLMGWLGFLIVFESLHGRLAPRNARRRLIAGVFLTALIGLIGYRFIDNAAHAGGLLAGMLYAAIVFPKSASPNRPDSTATDRIAGGTALCVLMFAAVLAMVKILTS